MAKKEKVAPIGPASKTQLDFIQHQAQFVIYGGGEFSASTLKHSLKR